MKVEGVLEADPDTVYNFLKISTREGGKVCPGAVITTETDIFVTTQLDYIFRNETLLDEIEGKQDSVLLISINYH